MPIIAKDLWDQALIKIAKEIPEITFKTWIAPLKAVSCEGDTFVLEAPNEFNRDQVKQYEAFFRNALMSIVPVQFHIKLTYEGAETPTKNTFSLPQTSIEGNINPAFTFDNFIVGSSNAHAHAACVSVAQNSRVFNPLFLYGGSGLGKTHLLHAIGNYVKQHQPEKHIIYVPCEQFVNEFIRTIRENSYDSFRQKYRNCDMLLIDDIQFIESKEQMQIEFFSTFNALTENGSNIIMTCDKPPHSLSSLEERLRTRFASGVIVDINIPNFETRVAILQKRAEFLNIQVSYDILEYIAHNFVSSIRELEGAFTTVISYSYISGKLDLSVAKAALNNLISPSKRKSMTPETIIPIVARYFNFTEDEIKSKNKNKDLAIARQVTMYLLTKHSDLTYEQIGKIIGGKHHSTVMYGFNKINDEIKGGNQTIISAVNDLNQRILGG
ncbi:hypothetical protein B7R76_06305 [Mageeibacillus indolicus]|uniref:Chromosomal replication initiator protein DnaA n=1 Tax=Mageeibacillus indolicus TaxID=884684 RepID=A0A2J8B100_9FIRM|nr:chromosomal replication initiator protein DnaA [Mageeibacillus indolicus]PNH18448.1 hypothetical protein B7R76_06305 [Mageeibacillus indolicus]